jgi:hypothetical protein
MFGDTSMILNKTPFLYSPPRRKHCTRTDSFLRLNLFGGGAAKNPTTTRTTLDKLLTLVQQNNRGVAIKKEQLAEIKQLFAEVENSGSQATEEDISGTWRLLWTTEKARMSSLDVKAMLALFCYRQMTVSYVPSINRALLSFYYHRRPYLF